MQTDMQTGSVDYFLYDDMMIQFFTNFFFFFFYYLLYVSVDWRRKIGILSKSQNNKVSFTCQLGWVGFD